MESSLIAIFGLLIFMAFILLVAVVSLYNTLIRKRNAVDMADGSVNVNLKKRFDLLPNLVTVVEKYAAHEKEVLTKVTELRKVMNTSNPSPEVSDQIAKMMGSIMVTVENYPELKANTNFLQLQAAWNECEEQISASRRFFNTAVTDYNNAIQVFPNSIIANMFGFHQKLVFDIDAPEKENIHASELFSK